MTTNALYLKRGDTRPTFRGQLLDPDLPGTGDDQAVDLTTASEARLHVMGPFGDLIVDQPVVIENQVTSKGWVTRAWGVGETDHIAGHYRCEVTVEWGDGTLQTFPPDRMSEIIITQDLVQP